jgi:hypothetical protein
MVIDAGEAQILVRLRAEHADQALFRGRRIERARGYLIQ